MRAGSFTMGLTVTASNLLLSEMPCSWTPKTGLSIKVGGPQARQGPIHKVTLLSLMKK